LTDTGLLRRTDYVLGGPGFGQRTYWLREGFTGVNQITPVEATVQFNPVRDEVIVSRVYSGRQAAMGDASCGSSFGGDSEKCRSAFRYFAAVFNNPDAVRGWNVDQFCNAFGISALVATDADPVWRDPASWVWTRPVLV